MIKREFAPPEERLRQLIAREGDARGAGRGEETRESATHLHRDCHRADGWQPGFFETAVASAFPGVTDTALLAEFKAANDAVVAAMAE